MDIDVFPNTLEYGVTVWYSSGISDRYMPPGGRRLNLPLSVREQVRSGI